MWQLNNRSCKKLSHTRQTYGKIKFQETCIYNRCRTHYTVHGLDDTKREREKQMEPEREQYSIIFNAEDTCARLNDIRRTSHERYHIIVHSCEMEFKVWSNLRLRSGKSQKTDPILSACSLRGCKWREIRRSFSNAATIWAFKFWKFDY